MVWPYSLLWWQNKFKKCCVWFYHKRNKLKRTLPFPLHWAGHLRTCAAMTRCLSAMRVHLAQTQSRHLQYRLWPFRADTTPWLRQRAHLGVRWYRSVARRKKAGGMVPSTGCWDMRADTSIPLGRLILQGEPSNHTCWQRRAWLYCRTLPGLLCLL
jgi:hypothetical protein